MSQWIYAKHGPEAGPTEPPKRANRRAASRRAAKRKPQRLLDGFVSSDRMSTRPCTIRDMSATGSRIEFWGDNVRRLLSGHRVILYIPSDGAEIEAEVMWREANVMGLRFTSGFRAPTRQYG
jgi:PilZ domain